jgi:hypothetical protein
MRPHWRQRQSARGAARDEASDPSRSIVEARSPPLNASAGPCPPPVSPVFAVEERTRHRTAVGADRAPRPATDECERRLPGRGAWRGQARLAQARREDPATGAPRGACPACGAGSRGDAPAPLVPVCPGQEAGKTAARQAEPFGSRARRDAGRPQSCWPLSTPDRLDERIEPTPAGRQRCRKASAGEMPATRRAGA